MGGRRRSRGGPAPRKNATPSREARAGQSDKRRSSHAADKDVTYVLRRDLIAGAGAGLAGGLVFGLAMRVQGVLAEVAGLIGSASLGAGLTLHLVISVLVGAGFGAIFRYQPRGYAAALSGGLLYGQLWWILGPLTLVPLLLGRGPTWSLAEAAAAFPNLVGHLLYGSVTGLAFHALVTFYLRTTSELEGADTHIAVPDKRVVILGAGFGGVAAARRLEQLLRHEKRVEVTLVSQGNYLLFTPMLAEVASGALAARHISAPVRAAVPRTHFRRAEVEAIDTDARVVWVRPGATHSLEKLPYDHLVLALGSVPNYLGLPGLEENAFTLKTLQDATRLRNHVISLLERADAEPDPEERHRQLAFVVAGGGYAGTEMIAELFDLVHSVLRYYPHIDPRELRFVLVHSGDRILPEISMELAEYALSKLRARGIEFLLRVRVAGAGPDTVLLADGGRIPSRTLVWTAGNRPNPLLDTLPCEHNKAGAVVAESTLRVSGLTNIWAVGDCAEIPDAYNKDKPYPPTAQHALREGKLVAENIAAVLRGKAPKRFRFRAVGTLVALGHRTAIAELRGRKFSGPLAWFMWRTVYLGKLPSLEKKVHVALDWTVDLFFPRDIVLTANTPEARSPRSNASDSGIAAPRIAKEPAR